MQMQVVREPSLKKILLNLVKALESTDFLDLGWTR